MAKFKIDAQILVFTTMFLVGTGATYAITRVYQESDEQKEERLRIQYRDRIQGNELQRKNFQDFFDKMKNPNDKDLDAKFQEVLKGGKGDIKRVVNTHLSNKTTQEDNKN